MRATALTEPGPVDGPLSATAATPAGRSTATGDPHTNWTERRGPVTTNRTTTDANNTIATLTLTLDRQLASPYHLSLYDDQGNRLASWNP